MQPSFRRVSWIAVFAGVLFLLSARAGYPQGANLPADIIQRMLFGGVAPGQLGNGQTGDQTTPSIEIYQPVVPQITQVSPPSRLEALYSSRAGRPLTQFGYDILGVPTSVSAVQVGGVQDTYILSEGDEIVIDLRGEDNVNYRQRVSRDGQIVFPRLNPIPAAGRTFRDFRADLERQVARAYVSTNVFASVGQIRQISVLVTGEVRAPGTRILNGLATPLDAMLLSGGISKSGSLRNVMLIRGNQTIPIDLYGLLIQGTLPNLGSLRNGDRIFVPPIHNTIAVSGQVRRPAIYELRDGETGLEADSLIKLAGDLEIAGAYRISKTNLEADGSIRLVSVTRGERVLSGEILFVDTATDIALGRVNLAGAVRLPGVYPYAVTGSVARLLRSSDALLPDAYAPFAVIVRRDTRLNVHILMPFSLVPILSGGPDVPLQSDDLLYVFTREEVRLLAATATGQPLPAVSPAAATGNRPAVAQVVAAGGNAPAAAPAVIPQSQDAGIPVSTLLSANGVTPDTLSRNPNLAAAITALGPNARIVGIDRTSITAAGVTVPSTAAASAFPDMAQQTIAQAAQFPGVTAGPYLVAPSLDTLARTLGTTTDSIVRIATDHVIWVLDEVRDPGPYVAGEGTTLGEMIQVAGGVLRQADLSSVEVTSTQIDPQSGTSRTIRVAYKGSVGDFQKVSLRPLDVIRLRPVFSDREDGHVTVSGQVRYPGTFDITRGERLSSVLERAGGTTDTAYPYGAVFTRERAATAEREGTMREARSISAEIGSLATSPNPNDRDKVSFLTSLVQQVQNEPALGRITVTADPAILRIHPELDVILEPGDVLVIPPRPSTVTVVGEVLNPGSFQYRPGSNVRDYINVAGNMTQGADEDRIFVVLPDGAAQPARESWLTFNNLDVIPPGSTVVIPRDLRPFDLSQFLKDAAQITSQLAVTAATLVVIGR